MKHDFFAVVKLVNQLSWKTYVKALYKFDDELLLLFINFILIFSAEIPGDDSI